MNNPLRNISEMHLEVARSCNLSCTYCYAHRNSDGTHDLMPLHVACNYLDLVMSETCSDEVNVVFHGGEPLMQTATWFENVIEYANRLAGRLHKTARYQMQSNLSLLTPRHRDLIRRHKIVVGSSLDGPSALNDIARGETKSVLAQVRR